VSIVYIPEQLRKLLEQAKGNVELCDYHGNLLGNFLPAQNGEKRKSPEPPPLCEEELQRRENEEGGLTTEEFLASIEGFPCSR
jgi:hypothetical protein